MSPGVKGPGRGDFSRDLRTDPQGRSRPSHRPHHRRWVPSPTPGVRPSASRHASSARRDRGISRLAPLRPESLASCRLSQVRHLMEVRCHEEAMAVTIESRRSTSAHVIEEGLLRRRLWRAVAALEVLAATAAVVSDLLVPSLVLAAMALLSLAVRRQSASSLGLRRVPAGPLALRMLLFAMVWSMLQLGLTMPVANHVSGTRQDLSGFADVQGNLALLGLLVVLSWSLAALVEEFAFRGYLQTRMRDVLGGGSAAA